LDKPFKKLNNEQPALGYKDYSHQGGINEKGLCFDANALPIKPDHLTDILARLMQSKESIGDAELNRWAVENGIKVNTDYGKKDVCKLSEMAQEFLKLYTNVEVQYSHDRKEGVK
jgi:hypothetical protein